MAKLRHDLLRRALFLDHQAQQKAGSPHRLPSAELSHRRQPSMMAVSKVCWQSFGTFSRASPAMVCRLRS